MKYTFKMQAINNEQTTFKIVNVQKTTQGSHAK